MYIYKYIILYFYNIMEIFETFQTIVVTMIIILLFTIILTKLQ